MIRRTLALALCLAVADNALAADAEESRIEAATAEVARLVAQVSENDDKAVEKLARQLVELPEELRPALLPVVRAGLLDRPDSARRRVTDRTLELLGEGRRAELLRPLAGDGANLDDRVFLLWYVREHGLRDGVSLSLSAARGASTIERRSQVLRGALRAAVERHVEREPSGLDVLSRQFARLPGEFQRTLLQGAEQLAPRGTARWVASLLVTPGDHKASVLKCLAGLPVLDPRAVDMRTSVGLVNCLGSEDVTVRRSAAACVGRLHVVDAAPRLIELLSDADASVASVALKSLRKMTTARLAPLPGGWEELLEREATWLEDEAPARLMKITGSEEETLDALRGLGRHRLHRAELWSTVAGALRSGTVNVRRAASDVLGILGEPAAIQDLLRAVGDSDADVAASASRALSSITGLRKPAAPAAWADLIPGRGN